MLLRCGCDLSDTGWCVDDRFGQSLHCYFAGGADLFRQTARKLTRKLVLRRTAAILDDDDRIGRRPEAWGRIVFEYEFVAQLLLQLRFERWDATESFDEFVAQWLKLFG